MKAGLLRCEECGCISSDGRGWVGMSAFDPDDNEPPSVVMYCPPRAAGEFDYRTSTTDKYVCVWPPLSEELSSN